MTDTYQGWKNRATWNVALWINNDEQIYNWACDFMKSYKDKDPYYDFIDAYGLISTPDGYRYFNPEAKMDIPELNKMMQDFKDEK